MSTTLADLAQLVHGTLLGDGSIEIAGASTLDAAAASDISLLDTDEKMHWLRRTDACAVVVPKNVAPEMIAAIQVDDVHGAFAQIVLHFRPPRAARRIGISPLAIVSPAAQIGDDVDIHPGAVIGDAVVIGGGSTIHAGVVVMAGCRVGRHVTIFPSAVLYEDTTIGDRTIVHGGAVLGAYGFGYDSSTGRHVLSAQLGYVEVGRDVEIGAGTTIDRGTYGPTVIGEGTKIDNLVMIGHNCRIGRHNMICSQVGVAGSCTTGDYVVMAGQVGVKDHVRIGDGAVLGGMAGIMSDVPAGETYVGVPATPIKEQGLKQAVFSKLPEMRKELKELTHKVDQLIGGDQQQPPAAA